MWAMVGPAVEKVMENVGRENRLAGERSPYLRQHAGNPVDWYPWGGEAFAKAAAEDKPIFLSVGYSTCHWCHVMAHESFEDEEVARVLNETFVCVKVDREERPDIDAIYMMVCQMLTGRGGWPMTIIMTADRKPFFAGTYFPKRNQYGHMGLTELAIQMQRLWREQRRKLLDSAEQVTAVLRQLHRSEPGEELAWGEFDRAFMQLQEQYDTQNGGFGGAPKFPNVPMLHYLLRYWRRTGAVRALTMVEETLRAMRRGGIFDHVGFGFHRYATDVAWRVPHFEKMLYDQAMLGRIYLEAFQATGDSLYSSTAREVFDYVLRDMTSPEGGFYCAEDADSEGIEGKYYLWGHEEFNKALPNEIRGWAAIHYGIEQGGNYIDEVTGRKTGLNILYEPVSVAENEKRDEEDEYESRIECVRSHLLACRENRVRPERDDKILTDLNGMMISSMAIGGRILGDERYRRAAIRSAKYIMTTLVGLDGRLGHCRRVGEAVISGNLDDYAFMMQGVLELYEMTHEANYLEQAVEYHRQVNDLFLDKISGGYYFTSEDGSHDLIMRNKTVQDGPTSSGNSVMLENLLRMFRVTGDAKYQEEATAMSRAFTTTIRRMPTGYCHFLGSEIILWGNPALSGAEY